MTFNMKNSAIYQDLSNVAEIPIYNALKLNSTNIGNLNDVEDGDLLTWDNTAEEWVYSSPIEVINSMLFVSDPMILNLDISNFVLDGERYSRVEFVIQRAVIGTDISFSGRTITINTAGTYQIDLDISYEILDLRSSSNILTILSSSSRLGETPTAFVSSGISSYHHSERDFHLSRSSGHITYVRTFTAGSNLSVWATNSTDIRTFLIPDQSRLLVRRIT